MGSVLCGLPEEKIGGKRNEINFMHTIHTFLEKKWTALLQIQSIFIAKFKALFRTLFCWTNFNGMCNCCCWSPFCFFVRYEPTSACVLNSCRCFTHNKNFKLDNTVVIGYIVPLRKPLFFLFLILLMIPTGNALIHFRLFFI